MKLFFVFGFLVFQGYISLILDSGYITDLLSRTFISRDDLLTILSNHTSIDQYSQALYSF